MAGPTKANKSTKTNASKGENQQDDKSIKVTLYVTPKLSKQFATHAVQIGQSKSDLFAEMIAIHCRRFVVHDHAKDAGRAKGTAESDDEIRAGQGEENVA